ncbi:phage tail tape measure protein [Corallococcus praedator]|uniref:Phage tail tape measure protein n=1 Tax=Corallococcus praedator TaxID=2316724 RepID=A0ABX9QJT6_9BACT|nr:MULTISPECIES: phage tail tape measure protein [Corallococcus]RKH35671.1 phage tail tape measure protein [Corallococcus sp. CA031C]RKI09644.1 phage tail tape measure protein [Corallococcus praedator]
MLNNLGLGFVFTARDLASGVFTQLEVNFTRLDKRVGLGTARIEGAFQRLGIAMALFTAGAVTIGASLSLANAAGEFEQAVAGVAAVSGASAEELRQLRDAALEASLSTQFTPTESVLGLRELTQAGFTAAEAMKLLEPVLDLAGGSLGELTPQGAAGLASQAMKAFGISTDKASLSVDQMLQAVNVFALSANELPLALGTAARGAQALNQELPETLIALGLVKNVVPGVERASTAVAVAMERMADPEVQQRLRGVGVAVTDAGGNFLSFLGILDKLSPALSRMTEAQRSAFLLKTFGREALGGVNAILTQLTDGVRKQTGEVVRGAAALEYLRDEFTNAGGTAEKFRQQMLDTYEGQKKLLAGRMTALAIVLGGPFDEVLKPLVALVADAVNQVLGVFQALPGPVKRVLAAFTLAAGSVIALVGAVISGQVSLALMVVGLKVLGLTLGGLLATVLPAVGAVVLLGVAVAGLAYAFRHNLGGLGDFARRVQEQVTLAFRGLVQLFEDGGFSGAVREELGRAENAGLKDFLINLYLWGHRIHSFFSGLADGFSAGLEAARPTLDAFQATLQRVGEAMGFLSERDDAATAAAKFAAFGDAGATVGRALARVFDFVVMGMTAGAEVAEGLAGQWHYMKAGVDVLLGSLAHLGRVLGGALSGLFGTTSAVQQGTSGWTLMGEALGFAIGNITTVIGVLVSAVSLVVSVVGGILNAALAAFSGIIDVFWGVVLTLSGALTGNWAEAWTGLKLIVFGVVDAISGVLLELVGTILGVVDAVASLFGKDTGLQQSLRTARLSLHRDLSVAFGLKDSTGTAAGPVTSVDSSSSVEWPLESSSMPAVAALQASLPQAEVLSSQPDAPPAAPVLVSVQVDGEVLAQATARAERDSASRSFSPMASY